MSTLILSEEKVLHAPPPKAFSERKSSPFWPAAIFLANFLFFAVFRIGISEELFGGDTVNLSLFRSNSYALQGINPANPLEFYKAIQIGKLGNPQRNANSFVYNFLSERGKNLLEHVLESSADEREREELLLEINRSLVDRKINWPEIFSGRDLRKGTFATGDPIRDENLWALSQIFPQYIRPEWQSKADLSSMIKNLPTVASYYFTVRTPTRYSPLSNLWVHEIQLFLLNAPERTPWAVAAMGIVYAALMTSIFLLSRALIPSTPWALVAMFLYQASISTILSAYSLFSLPYLFVPLSMASAFYSYLRFRGVNRTVIASPALSLTGLQKALPPRGLQKALSLRGHEVPEAISKPGLLRFARNDKDAASQPRNDVRWLLPFIFFSLIGPWFREFPGAVPFIVFASELVSFRGRRSIAILMVCIPLMLHSIFPSFLPWLLGINKGAFYGVFAQDNTLAQSAGLRFNRNAVGFLFVQFPPILWILSLFSVGRWISVKLKGNLRLASLALLLILSVGAFYSFFVEANLSANPIKIKHGMLLFLTIASLTAFSFRWHPLPSIYFAATFLPFLKMRLSEMHISFALIPFAILFTFWLRDLFKPFLHPGGVKKVISYALAGLLGWGLGDHAMNLTACFLTQRRLVETNQQMAGWLKGNVPRHSVLIMNFYNLTDVFYYSRRHFDPYCSVESCPFDPSKVAAKEEEFRRLLAKSWGIRNIYFLASEHESLPWEGEYYRHKYVLNPPGQIEKKAEFSARSVYYFLDPIKNLVPRHFLSFPGYMDWSSDFEVKKGPFPFQRTVKANYTLYQLKEIHEGLI